jgi:hypothetical protein
MPELVSCTEEFNAAVITRCMLPCITLVPVYVCLTLSWSSPGRTSCTTPLRRTTPRSTSRLHIHTYSSRPTLNQGL